MNVRLRLALVAAAIVVVGVLAYRMRFTGRSVPPDSLLKVPDGFEVERVAGPPLVYRPIVADFDDQGRLYVADSSGSNDPVEKQLAEKPHRIVRLEDRDGDGRFDTSIVFADRMMFPEGAMWFDGSLYVAAPPSIWKLTDTDGDGRADQREEWFQGKTLTHCANDLHGPYLGPDGWIYWCKGAFAKQTYERPGKSPLVTRAAHIFRRRPGQSLVESVMTGGMDNPVDVAFTPSGEPILTATFFEHPQLGRRDALLHAVYGGVYGKPHDVLAGHTRTGELMPELAQYGPAAPCGLTHYSSRVFGDEYQDNFFACLFNLHKVTRHALRPEGASFKSQDSDFLVSTNPDFHPTDVLEDADGSLVVIDTGGWYKLCCPTSQLEKPDVLGAIYRVRRKGAVGIDDPRGLRLPWSAMKPQELVARLDESRPAVRNRAMHQLAKLGAASIPVLRSALSPSASVAARRNAVWTLTRIQDAAAREAVREALKDPDIGIRQAAAHAASVWRDSGAFPLLIEALKTDAPALQRTAAEALGRIGNRNAVPELLLAASVKHDRTLEHSLTYALIEIGDPAATAPGLNAASSHTRRAALVALDQMDGGGLAPEAVTPLLTSADPVLRETAWWIATHHPDWGPAMARHFLQRLVRVDLDPAQREELEGQLAQFGESAAIQELLSATAERGKSKEARRTALAAMARSRPKAMPAAWSRAFARVLAARDSDLSGLAVLAARSAKEGTPELHAALLSLARDPKAPASMRLDAAAAIPAGHLRVDAGLFDLLRKSIEAGEPVAVRSAAAAVLEKARLSREQLLGLCGPLARVGPMELPRVLAAFNSGGDEALGRQLLSALRQSKALGSLRSDALLSRLANYPDPVRRAGEELLASINKDAARQKERLREMVASVRGGDVRRGQQVFNSAKTACSACHAIGYLGGKVGPDLTKIGRIRTERDLLEAIIYPDSSFVQSYEPIQVLTESGEKYNGVLRRDSPDEIVLATSATDEVRIARAEIADIQPGTVSVMPSGMVEQLTRQELADLVAFLKAAR